MMVVGGGCSGGCSGSSTFGYVTICPSKRYHTIHGT